MLRVLVIIVALIGVLTAIYIALSTYARRRRARELEAEYGARGSHALTREDYVQRGLAEFDRSVPRRLILAVFAAPVVVFVGLVLLANYG